MKRKVRFIIKNIVRVSCTLLSCALIFTILCMGFETMFPIALQKVEMTNGEQTIIFEGMIHVASPKFYDHVREDIKHEKENGAAYFYEGIRHENRSEVTELTSRLTGGVLKNEDLGHSYGLLATVAGLQLQPQETFMGFSNTPDVNADVTASELLAVMKKNETSVLVNSSTDPNGIKSSNTLNDMEKSYANLSEKEKKIVNIITKNLISIVVRSNSTFYDGVTDKGAIEVFRNKYLADQVEKGPARIIITYGSAHLSGFFDEMHSRDPRWKVVSVLYRPAFTTQ